MAYDGGVLPSEPWPFGGILWVVFADVRHIGIFFGFDPRLSDQGTRPIK